MRIERRRTTKSWYPGTSPVIAATSASSQTCMLALLADAAR
jgi:hypothetical protein